MLNWDENWPYKQLSIHDNEQKLINENLKDCCVAFIDILGFKDMVSKNVENVILALRYIKLFRDSFCDLPSRKNTINEIQTDEEIDDEVLPKATMFSDSIVISQEMDDSFNFSKFIEFIATMQFELLRKGILIRGGIDTGKLYHDDAFIFGDGLISAYILESEYAKYPRIVVSQKLIQTVEQEIDKQFESEFSYHFMQGSQKYYVNPVELERYYDGDELYYISSDESTSYINFLRLGFSMIQASDAKYLESEIKLLCEFYDDTLLIIMSSIQIGMQNKDEHVREKFEWLKKLYNANIKTSLNTYQGKFKDKFSESVFFNEWNRKLLL